MIDRLSKAHPHLSRDIIISLIVDVTTRLSGKLPWTRDLPEKQMDDLIEFVIEEGL